MLACSSEYAKTEALGVVIEYLISEQWMIIDHPTMTWLLENNYVEVIAMIEKRELNKKIHSTKESNNTCLKIEHKF